MSWTSRFGNLGRFSPFTRSPPQGSTKVSDADFSYITAEDLRRHQAESTSQHSSEPLADYGPPRETDLLVLRNKKQEYMVHFPAYSIAKGELTIAQVRDQASKKVGAGDARRIKLLYKGKNLKDDTRTCKQEGLHDGVEVMCTVADRAPSLSESEDEYDEFADGAENTVDGEPRRKRNRGKKSKRRAKREERDNVASGSSTPQAGESNLGVPNSQQTSRAQSPKPTPTTPLGKLNVLHDTLQTFVPDCRAFLASPPSDPAKRSFEHKRLTETILTQVLLKVDGVDTDGDADARTRRKELVKETQKILQDLDAVMKS